MTCRVHPSCMKQISDIIRFAYECFHIIICENDSEPPRIGWRASSRISTLGKNKFKEVVDRGLGLCSKEASRKGNRCAEVNPNKSKMLFLWITSLLLWDASGYPIPWELVDMTYTFDETTLNWPTQKKFELTVTMNQTTEDGYWLQLEEYTSAIHAGTHMDAPCHFAKGKWCAEEIPLERLSGPAAVVDITDKALQDPDATVDVEDLKEWEAISGRSLNRTIVVMRSGWGRRWGDREAYIGTADNDTGKLHFPGMSPKAAQWLVDNRDVYGVASESLSLDRGKAKDFMAHRILLGSNIYGLENVANVEEIPIVGAYLHVLPMKIGRGSGAPTRIVAKYPKLTFKPKDGKSVTERSLREVIIFS